LQSAKYNFWHYFVILVSKLVIPNLLTAFFLEVSDAE
jgi:hypothetical protein